MTPGAGEHQLQIDRWIALSDDAESTHQSQMVLVRPKVCWIKSVDPGESITFPGFLRRKLFQPVWYLRVHRHRNSKNLLGRNAHLFDNIISNEIGGGQNGVRQIGRKRIQFISRLEIASGEILRKMQMLQVVQVKHRRNGEIKRRKQLHRTVQNLRSTNGGQVRERD